MKAFALLAAFAIVPAVQVAAADGAKISTAHVEITPRVSAAPVAAGGKVTLELDIEPHRGIRVYAPGATGYKAVTLKLEPQTFLRPRPPKFDPSEIYFFKALNERVPVYQKPFAVRQEVAVLATAQARTALRGKDSIDLKGVLDYQACDDEVCFIPVTVPVTWTVSIRPPASPPGTAPRPKA